MQDGRPLLWIEMNHRVTQCALQLVYVCQCLMINLYTSQLYCLFADNEFLEDMEQFVI